MRMDRTENTVKNVTFSMLSEFMLAVLKFVSRYVFVQILGKEYLGLDGLFTDILAVLSLAELGFSVSITYSLYRPAAEGDRELIKSLIRLYRRVYQIVGVTVLTVGAGLTPFLDFFVKEMPEDIPYIPLIYLLNVLNTGVAYFFTYKSTLLFVYQKKYIDTMIRAGLTLLVNVVQIVVLVVSGNYLYYLCILVAGTVLQNVAVAVKADRLYPYLREKEVRPLPGEILQDIRRNVSAMILNRVGAAAVFSTDNILISKFVGIITTGLYSNYVMIRGFLNLMVGALFNALTPALGSLVATETEEAKREAFRRLDFFGAWLFGWLSICLLWLFDPFITLWLGEDYLLPRPAVILIVINFYVNSMRIPVAKTRSAMGLFWDERYKSILEAIVNLVVSVLLAQRWGIVGILAGTLISSAALPFWIEPRGLYRYGFRQSGREYFVRYFLRLVVTVGAGALTGLLCRMTGENIGGFLVKGLVCLVVPNAVYAVAYRRTEECRFLGRTARSVLLRR